MLSGPFSYRIGITVSSGNSARIAVLKKTCKGHLLVHLKEGNPKHLLPLIHKYSYAATIASLSSSAVIIKHSESELKNSKHIQANIRFQIEQLLPFSPEAAIFRTVLSKKKSYKTDVFTFVTRKEKTHTLLNNLLNYDLIVDRISCCQLDLMHLCTMGLQNKKLTAPVIYFGNQMIHYILLKEGIPLFSHTFNFSLDTGAEEAIYNTLEYSKQHYPNLFEKIIHVINPPPHFLETLNSKEIFEFHEMIPKIFSGLDETERRTYGETIATALGGFDSDSPDFRQETEELKIFSFSKMLKKWHVPLTYLSLICAGITGITGFTLTTLAKLKVQESMKQISSGTTTKHGNTVNGNNSPRNCCIQIEQKLKQLRQSSQYPLIPENLSALRVLSKIVSLPGLKKSNVIFNQCSYEILDFPKLTSPDAKYIVEVILKGTVKERSHLIGLKEALTANFGRAKNDKFIWDEQNCNFTVSFRLNSNNR